MSIVHVPFYPSDWLAGTRGLSDAETGVYITLIARMYEMAAPIERDDNRLARLCGSKSKAAFVKALDYLISEGKIITVNGHLFNEKVEKVIKNTTERSGKAKSAAESRWKRKPNKNNGPHDAGAPSGHMLEGCHPNPYPKEEDKSSSQEVENYLKYLEAHPNPVPSDAGERAFSELVKAGEDPAQIIAAAVAFADHVKGWSDAGKVQQSDNFLKPEGGKWRGFVPKPKAPAATKGELMEFYAKSINENRFVSQNTITPTLARDMIAAGLVTAEKMAEKGFAA